MGNVTLILSRTPLHEFIYTARGNIDADNMTDDARKRLYRSRSEPLDRPANVKHYSGRWGNLLLLRGPQVFSVVPVNANSVAPQTVGPQYVTLADQKLQLTTDGRSIEFSKEYTSMERYRTGLSRCTLNTVGVGTGGKGFGFTAGIGAPLPLL